LNDRNVAEKRIVYGTAAFHEIDEFADFFFIGVGSDVKRVTDFMEPRSHAVLAPQKAVGVQIPLQLDPELLKSDLPSIFSSLRIEWIEL
jgi:hypothetical protein